MRVARQIIRDNHYTRCVPSGKSHYYRFEDAIVVYSIPANRFASRAVLGVDGRVWELTRLWAPDGHAANLLTRAIAHTARDVARIERLDAIVSYADPNAGHHGGVYQAASWTYQGQSTEGRGYVDASGHMHARRKFHSGGTHMNKAEIEASGFRQVKLSGKHRYARGFTKLATRIIGGSTQPYPKPSLAKAVSA